MDPAQEELESLLNQGTENETPAPEATPVSEQVDYFLGDKANKLPLTAEFQFTENGKAVKAPLSTIINHYRQRSALDQKFAEFNKTKESFDSERKEWGDLEQYRQLQKWSLDHPDEFSTIWDLYQNKDRHLIGQKNEGNQAVIDELLSLKRELQGLKEFKSQLDQDRAKEVDEKNLAELEIEVDNFKKDFPEVNLDGESEMILTDGQKATVKQAIMLYGYKHGIPDFESAALKFLKPKLMEIVAQRARQEAVKGVKLETQAGVIARSSTPLSGQSSKVNPAKMSWSDAKNAAKAELETLLRG